MPVGHTGSTRRDETLAAVCPLAIPGHQPRSGTRRGSGDHPSVEASGGHALLLARSARATSQGPPTARWTYSDRRAVRRTPLGGRDSVEASVRRVHGPLLAALFTLNVAVAGRVPLQLGNPGGEPVERWPVTTGIPFSSGMLTSARNVRLLDGGRREIPLQVECTGRHQDGSVRWLLLDFQADVPASGSSYQLEFGDGIGRAAVPHPVVVEDTDSSVGVDTGPFQFSVSKRRFNGLDSVVLNGSEVLVAGHSGGPHFVDDRGIEFRACLDPSPNVAVELHGALRTVVTARGWFVDASGEKKCRYIVRFHAYAGLPYVRVFTTWLMTEDSRTLRFRDIGFHLPVRAEECAVSFDDGARTTLRRSGSDVVGLVQDDVDRFRLRPGGSRQGGAQPHRR